jgi:hypothetical protein
MCNVLTKNIKYKDFKFNVSVYPNDKIVIKSKTFPLEIVNYYSLEEPIMNRVIKLLDEANVDKYIERFIEFYG